MTWADVVMAIVKIVVMFGFVLNMAAISVWADRRQGALAQDRVGPNRAVVHVPSNALRVVVFLVTAIVAGIIAIPMWAPARGQALAKLTSGVEIAILVGWFSLLLLSNHVRNNGADNALDELVASVEPRAYFYGGLVFHLAALVLVRLVPAGALEGGGIQWGTGLAGTLAAVVIMSAGFYTAAKLPDGTTELRLAGTLHAIADTLKSTWKEDLRPRQADKLLYEMAPLLAMIPALVTLAVIPFGSAVCFQDANHNGELDFGELFAMAGAVPESGVCGAGFLTIPLQVADLNVGLLYIFAIAGTGIIGAAIAGWSSDNKFALLGGLRATSQMVSYEVALGLSIVGMLMIAGSVNLGEIVAWQGQNAWGIFAQPVAFFLFFASVVAETKRVPFDQPEGESEIVAGYFVEYSGMKWLMFMVGEYVEFVFASALMVTLFFGGYHLPFLDNDGLRIAIGDSVLYEMKMNHTAVTLIRMVGFFGKTVLFWFAHVFVRWTLPRFRYDQLMKLGWTKLLPLALANIMVTGLILVGIDGGGPGVQKVVTILGDLTQAVVALVGLIGAVAFVTWLLEPSKRRRLVMGTAGRYADNAGGVKPTEMQA
ncbi:MAG: complex I subunit 1 family protein [Polyangiaceae bacterium]